MFDGDTLFALSTGRRRGDVSIVGAYAAEAVAQAIVRAVMFAEGLAGLPAAKDMMGQTWPAVSVAPSRPEPP
jgi:L-aminopeptidase/D-esterase-like protein